jgi:16S rRNA (adenine1518-N6/adenine1519-N6)-dimethyltransferase
MSIISQIKKLSYEYNFRPFSKKGQNFLINPLFYDKIVKTADLSKSDVVLEIGAGFGTLTKELAKKVKKVIAVEIDKKLVEILKKELKDFKNVKLIEGDILKLKFSDLKLKKNYKIVANLPFSITGKFLKKFLAGENRLLKPKLMVLMLQKEVAQRIVAKPGDLSLLSIMVQFYSQPKLISYVSKNNFWPKPKVDSAILKIEKIKQKVLNKKDEILFFKILKAGFSKPRKYLLNNLFKAGIIKNKKEGEKIFKKVNLALNSRAEELKIEDWLNLFKKIYEK